MKLRLISLPFIYRALRVLASLMHFSLKQEGKLNTQPSPSAHAGSTIQRQGPAISVALASTPTSSS